MVNVRLRTRRGGGASSSRRALACRKVLKDPKGVAHSGGVPIGHRHLIVTNRPSGARRGVCNRHPVRPNVERVAPCNLPLVCALSCADPFLAPERGPMRPEILFSTRGTRPGPGITSARPCARDSRIMRPDSRIYGIFEEGRGNRAGTPNTAIQMPS